MPGARVVASSRPVYEPAPHRLTFPIPSSSKGDVLLAVIVHATADDFTAPAGWAIVGSDGASIATVHYLARMVDGSEGASLVLSLVGVTGEWQGQMIALRGVGALALIKEASASATFTGDATPDLPATSSLQAINRLIATWSADGVIAMTPPTGYAAIDSYTSALVDDRSLMIAERIANATGTIASQAAAASPAATGRAFVLVLRDALPMTPLELYDPIPGNLGLIGVDRRPAREAI